MPILAQQLVDLHPDVIVSITTPATAAVKATTGNRVAGVPIDGTQKFSPTPGSILSQLRAARLTLSGYTARASPSKGRLMRYTVPGSTLNTT